MKTLRNFSGLMLVVICLSSCRWFYHDDIPIFDSYNIAFCFQDALGNNVSEGIGSEELRANEGTIDPDLYSLDIVPQNYINGETVPGPDVYPQSSSLGTMKHDKLGTCLRNDFSWYEKKIMLENLLINCNVPIFSVMKKYMSW